MGHARRGSCTGFCIDEIHALSSPITVVVPLDINCQSLNLLSLPKQIVDLASKPTRASGYMSDLVQGKDMVGKFS
jgi:hypothetical protein